MSAVKYRGVLCDEDCKPFAEIDNFARSKSPAKLDSVSLGD